jgi:transcription elongation factor Elf1
LETDTHKWLKRIALNFLREKGQDVVVNEVGFKCGIADAIGLNYKRKEVRVVECKATKQDYVRDKKLFWDKKYNYYSECHYFYIMCPENVIDKSLVAPGVGLIYVKDNDEYEIVKKPVKNTSKLKTLFDTTLKKAVHRLSNEMFFKNDKEFKDSTEGKYSKKADVIFAAVRCPHCKHVTKDLLNKNTTTEIKCKNCKEIIQVKETKVREITAYNKTFIDKINKLVK